MQTEQVTNNEQTTQTNSTSTNLTISAARPKHNTGLPKYYTMATVDYAYAATQLIPATDWGGVLVGFIFAYSCKLTVGPSSASGCRQTECRLPRWSVSVTDMTNVSVLCWKHDFASIKERSFSNFSHLRTGARTGCISATIKYCTHTNSTLSCLFYNKELCSLPDFIL